MKKQFALWLIASGLLSSLSAGGGAPATDPPLDLATALKATSANPALGDQAQVLGRIIGTWDVEYTGTWRATFVDPEHGSAAKFTGGPVGNDRYVLETPELGSKQTRWSFNDIRSDSFVWRDEASNDDGKTWKLQAEYQMKRRRANL